MNFFIRSKPIEPARFVGVKEIKYRGAQAVFEIPTAHKGLVYMSVSPSACEAEDRSIVIIDVTKFIKLWRRSPFQLHKEIREGSVDEWRLDRKFHWAEDGFSNGISNPVPLADLDFNISWMPLFPSIPMLRKVDKSVEHIVISDGVTRSIWLFCQGASSIPIAVKTEFVERLRIIADVKEIAVNPKNTPERAGGNHRSAITTPQSP